MTDLSLKIMVLGWDIEYWQSYIRSYKENTIYSISDIERNSSLKKCKLELLKTEEELKRIKVEFAEELI
jgi:hypothetical protein